MSGTKEGLAEGRTAGECAGKKNGMFNGPFRRGKEGESKSFARRESIQLALGKRGPTLISMHVKPSRSYIRYAACGSRCFCIFNLS